MYAASEVITLWCPVLLDSFLIITVINLPIFSFLKSFFRLFYMYCSRWQQSKVNKLGGWRGGLARRCVVTARVTDGAMKKSAWDTED